MAVALPIMMIVSAAVAGFAAIQQGKAQTAASTFNAITALQDRTMARSEALLQAQQTQRETMLRLGKARATAGKAGGTGEGSTLDVIGDLARQGELERQYNIYQGEAKARGYTNTATLDFMQGESAREASYLRAGTELLGGGYTAASVMKRGA